MSDLKNTLNYYNAFLGLEKGLYVPEDETSKKILCYGNIRQFACRLMKQIYTFLNM